MKLAVSQTSRSAVVVLLGSLAASVAFAQIDPGNKPVQRNNPGPPTQNILVVNGTGQPVPTAPQGTTNVAGTVNVGNTPNVTITNTPSVNVANTPAVTLESGASVGVTSPLDGQGNATPIAVLDAFQIYEDRCAIIFSGAGFGDCQFQTIPSDKQLVIQEFDAISNIDVGVRPQDVALYTGALPHVFPATFMTTAFGTDIWVTNAETRVYVAPGATPACSVPLSADTTGNYFCALSGFLVDAPLGAGPASPAQGRQRLQLPNGRNPWLARQMSNAGH